MGRIHNLNRKVGRMGLLNLLYLTSMPTEHKNKYFAVGLGVFAMIWAVLWALNIAKYNTIIYYPIIELFK